MFCRQICIDNCESLQALRTSQDDYKELQAPDRLGNRPTLNAPTVSLHWPIISNDFGIRILSYTPLSRGNPWVWDCQRPRGQGPVFGCGSQVKRSIDPYFGTCLGYPTTSDSKSSRLATLFKGQLGPTNFGATLLVTTESSSSKTAKAGTNPMI